MSYKFECDCCKNAAKIIEGDKQFCPDCAAEIQLYRRIISEFLTVCKYEKSELKKVAGICGELQTLFIAGL